ncbi:cholecystokinin receptor type A [Drosophila tropicalis]|uniref:cholecystokinin receptor type A n=1 Tax=Drosophila tropicalis TaxID=46794 RepID=UPI0035ABD2D2
MASNFSAYFNNTSASGSGSSFGSGIYDEADAEAASVAVAVADGDNGEGVDISANNFNMATSELAATTFAPTSSTSSSTSATEMPFWLIPSYSVIFIFAVLGNVLVISTLVQNRRMRTITNVFLLNLAISDVLLGVFCMPVTLAGTLMRQFIFGEFLCKLFQFAQAASVAVSSWTLVAISCERYYAICHPLRSRSWQTISHAYKIIGFIWLGGILCMTPIAVFSQLIPTSRPGYCKCREIWPDQGYERLYNILLDFLLLVLPLLVLCVAYILITRTLYVGMGKDAVSRVVQQASGGGMDLGTTPGSSNNCILVLTAATDYNDGNSTNNNNGGGANTATATTTLTTITTAAAGTAGTLATTTSTTAAATAATTSSATATTTVTLAKTASPSLRMHDAALRRSNEAKTLESKKRVVKMLFVLVLEFFICWTPLYVINTLSMFIGQSLYEYIDYTSIGYMQLLAYSSSCCNPITYCFMNASFRRAFVDTFKGIPWHRSNGGATGLAGGHSASQVVMGGQINQPNIAIGLGSSSSWRNRSRHEQQLLNSVVHTNSGAVDSPRL